MLANIAHPAPLLEKMLLGAILASCEGPSSLSAFNDFFTAQ